MFWPDGPAFDVIICAYGHLENAPARGPPGNVIDPGFCDVFSKVLQLVCCCLSGINFSFHFLSSLNTVETRVLILVQVRY